MKRRKKCVLLLVAIVGSCVFRTTTYYANEVLEDNRVDLKVDRIESNNGQKEMKGQNDETLFNDVYTSKREEAIKQKEDASENLQEQLFVTSWEEKSEDDSYLFTGYFTTQADESKNTLEEEKKDGQLFGFFAFIGIGVLAGVIFLGYSTLKQYRGDTA